MQDRFKFRFWNKLSSIMTYNFMFGNFMQKSLEDYEKKDWVDNKREALLIIDGVDVSKCEYWSGSELGYCNIGLWANDGTHICECEIDCLYKQLKRKVQECEELKIYIESNEQQVKEVETLVMDNDRLINELDQLKTENEELKEQIKKHNDDMFKNPPEKRFYCKGCTLPYISKKLKAENKELEGIRDRNFLHALEEQKRADKLSKTLTEIKDYCNKYPQNSIGFKQQILQKISECEGNDE